MNLSELTAAVIAIIGAIFAGLAMLRAKSTEDKQNALLADKKKAMKLDKEHHEQDCDEFKKLNARLDKIELLLVKGEHDDIQ